MNVKIKNDLEKLEKEHSKLIDTLDAFNGSMQPINYEDLDKFPLMEWVPINEKVKIRKRNMHFGDHLNFDTHMEKGGEFGRHMHHDVIESTEIIKGKVVDLETYDLYEEGEILHYSKKQWHVVVALEHVELKVLFKK